MSKKQSLIILGAWISVLLFLGFPASWDRIIGLITGLIVIGIALKLPHQERTMPTEKRPYVETKNPAHIARNPIPSTATQAPAHSPSMLDMKVPEGERQTQQSTL
jgi:hypothetical protein